MWLLMVGLRLQLPAELLLLLLSCMDWHRNTLLLLCLALLLLLPKHGKLCIELQLLHSWRLLPFIHGCSGIHHVICSHTSSSCCCSIYNVSSCCCSVLTLLPRRAG